ncbi:SIS domain-containing protein [Aeromicrobium sp. IC_218]|uniref:SIS domain-containing protein n=1 Tax=Aeromicrobium sp. IC_218 TaxID=2545468 RepID=UPI001038CC43|nr:SIS domain-containing protein [Aeromicrobium sp. IC_218]TCI96777.1 SIS domain-containing protein [Aeromicrobium sp. IC_218]
MTVPGAHMRAEVAEQPDVWRRLVRDARGPLDEAAALVRSTDPELLHLVARGSSDHAALYGQYLAAAELGVPAVHSTPSLVTVFERGSRFPRTIQVALSQSGASPDLVATARAARETGVRAISITNTPDSPLAVEADVHVSLDAGDELSVAATKSYTAELLALYLLVGRVAGRSWDDLEAAVGRLAEVGDVLVEVASSWAASAAPTLAGEDRALLVGRGFSMASAKEGALKLIETSGLAASGWSSADARHGPVGQVQDGTPVVGLGLGTPGGGSTRELLDHVRILGARTLAVGGRTDHEDVPVPGLDGLEDALVPVAEIVPVQALALELSLSRHRDPDRPEGLSKVTRTR